MRILVQRAGALGDVILTTPIVARLRKELGPLVGIDIQTGCPAVYDSNPHITNVNVSGQQYDRVIDLNLAYECTPDMHILDAYMLQAFGDTNGNKRVVFGIDPPAPEALKRTSNVVLIHAPRSWPSKVLPESYWETLVDLLIADGFNVIAMGGGSGNDYIPKARPGFASLAGQTTLRQAASEISNARAIICVDSSLLHLAGATDTPIVGIFTSGKAEYRLPWRHGQLGWKSAAMYPRGLDCYGCHAKTPGPVTYLNCHRGDNICTTMISAEDTIYEMEKLLS